MILVVDAFEQVGVGYQHVVTLVHGHDCVLDLSGTFLSAWKAELKTHRPAAQVDVVTAVAAWLVAVNVHHFASLLVEHVLLRFFYVGGWSCTSWCGFVPWCVPVAKMKESCLKS